VKGIGGFGFVEHFWLGAKRVLSRYERVVSGGRAGLHTHYYFRRSERFLIREPSCPWFWLGVFRAQDKRGAGWIGTKWRAREVKGEENELNGFSLHLVKTWSKKLPHLTAFCPRSVPPEWVGVSGLVT